MTAFALITGTLFKEVDRKIAKGTGKPFVVATLKVAAGNAVEFWNIVAFSESVQDDLLRLGEGDKIALQGTLKIEPYTGRDGQTRIRRSLMADHLVCLRQPPNERRGKPGPTSDCDVGTARSPPFDDDIPF